MKSSNSAAQQNKQIQHNWLPSNSISSSAKTPLNLFESIETKNPSLNLFSPQYLLNSKFFSRSLNSSVCGILPSIHVPPLNSTSLLLPNSNLFLSQLLQYQQHQKILQQQQNSISPALFQQIKNNLYCKY